jgi:HEAT repeat protein
MNRNFILSILFVLFVTGIQAQQPRADLRTTETKIADLLMQIPADNSADHLRIMTELTQLGEAVIATIAPNLVAPGKGDDTNLRFAVSGLVIHAAKCGDKKIMQQNSNAITRALNTVKDEEVKDFLLQELQFIAGDEAVNAVAPLLLNTRLSDPAARVMVRINSAASNQAMMDALAKAGPAQQVVLVKALGETRFAIAAPVIRNLASSADPNVKKSALRALAKMGDPASAKMLGAAAKSAGYGFEPTEATDSWFMLLKNLAESGQASVASKAAKKLYANKSLPVNVRTSALYILSSAQGDKGLATLTKAMTAPDKEFRMAAQNLLPDALSPAITASLRSTISKNEDAETRAELVSLLGDQNDKSSLPLFLNLLNDNNRQVQLAAIDAAAKTGKNESVDLLTALLVKGDSEIITAAGNALLTIEGDAVTNAAAANLPQSAGEARIALINIISKRAAIRHAGLIFTEAGNPDKNIKEAAAAALQSVVRPGDEEKIATLLNKASSEEEVNSLQQAMTAALSQREDKKQQVSTVTRLMSQAGAQKERFYAVLASTGGTEALEVLQNEMKSGTEARKTTAIKALTSWSDESAIPMLYTISKESAQGNLRDMALTGYIRGINRSSNPPDQKVLMFRKAMELATSTTQKTLILEQVTRNPSLMSLVFAANCLDAPDLRQTAVQAVRTIYTASDDLYGPAVDQIVDKAISLNTNAEAEYQKQAMLKHRASMPKEGGFVSMFNGKDLSGWKGLVGNPISRSKMTPEKLAEEQTKANEKMKNSWKAENGILVFEGKGDNLCSDKMYGDFELFVDWRMGPKGDGGVYLRGSPQVQTWDTTRVEVGAQVGSGGLYNNKIYRSTPLVVADNPINDWNTFRIKMIGDKVTVYLNGQLVTDNVIMENYWDRNIPIFDKEAIELQAHGNRLEFRDIYVREIARPEPYTVDAAEATEGFVPLFNGIDLNGWTGNTTDYFAQEGMIVCRPTGKGSGNLFTEKKYSDFIMRFEFQLTPGANNGLGIRAPLTGDAAYQGMELQILDNEAAIYSKLQPYQYHGSVYGVIPAKRGFLKPVGEWNYQEVQAIGTRIRIILNGEVILDGDIAEASQNNTATIDKRQHPGLLNKSGHIGFLGHGSPLKFRNLRIKDLGNK